MLKSTPNRNTANTNSQPIKHNEKLSDTPTLIGSLHTDNDMAALVTQHFSYWDFERTPIM
jgi:hypothetical protein